MVLGFQYRSDCLHCCCSTQRHSHYMWVNGKKSFYKSAMFFFNLKITLWVYFRWGNNIGFSVVYKTNHLTGFWKDLTCFQTCSLYDWVNITWEFIRLSAAPQSHCGPDRVTPYYSTLCPVDGRLIPEYENFILRRQSF